MKQVTPKQPEAAVESKQVSKSKSAAESKSASEPKPVSPPPVVPVTESKPVAAKRIILIETCPSLSGKAVLTCHLAWSAESDVLVRVWATTGGAFFSREWISLKAIHDLFSRLPAEQDINAAMLANLYESKSTNNTGLLVACLVHLGILERHPEKLGSYRQLDPKPFFARVKSLIDAGTDLHVADEAKQKTTRAAPKGKASKGNAAKSDAAQSVKVTDTPKPSVTPEKE